MIEGVHMQLEIERDDIMLGTEGIILHFDTRGALYIAETQCTTIIKHRTYQRLETTNSRRDRR
jgi:hypothetical protein